MDRGKEMLGNQAINVIASYCAVEFSYISLKLNLRL